MAKKENTLLYGVVTGLVIAGVTGGISLNAQVKSVQKEVTLGGSYISEGMEKLNNKLDTLQKDVSEIKVDLSVTKTKVETMKGE